MNRTRNNHYVPQWYQKGFVDNHNNQLCHLKRNEIFLEGSKKIINSVKRFSFAQCFYKRDLYSILFGEVVNDDIEKQFFGPIDDNGAGAVKAFLTDDQTQWHLNFQNFFTYLDAQKLRTPKGLDWIKARYPELDQLQLMIEMQELRAIHCTLWAESVRELVSAENSEVKFILSDHPVTIYNYACPPESNWCVYPNDPDIALKGSQTIFPLDKNRCLILTNLEYAENPNGVNPLEQRTHATKIRQSLVNTVNFINKRKLTTDDVIKINHIIKSRAKDTIVAGKEAWLYPENEVNYDWSELRYVLMPSPDGLFQFGGEMVIGYDDGSTHYQDAFGRSAPLNKFLKKDIVESKLGRNDACGCGSALKYKHCCKNLPKELRTGWSELSIRERNLIFCRVIKRVLGLDSGKTWLDVRREIKDEQISYLYNFYSTLWPRETDIYSLLPKSDGKFRALYTGIVDVRVIGQHALPMASLFDEFLIEIPLLNPNNIKPEFSPIKSPSKYKYQALKDFLLMLELEPYIECGLINLIPDPSNFDLSLMSAMMDMATDRLGVVESEKDMQALRRLAIEDYLNVIHTLPRDIKIRSLIQEFGMAEDESVQFVELLDASAETSPLAALQPMSFGNGGQFIQSYMGPNYEMALFIAQVTGSVILTDSESRWNEFQTAQHKQLGMTLYPWNDFYRQMRRVPLDYKMLRSYTRTQFQFSNARTVLRNADEVVLADKRTSDELKRVTKLVVNLNHQIERIDNDSATEFVNGDCKILAPDGGIYDRNVQRLLVRSGCSRYDQKVRSIYYIESKLLH